MAEQALDGIDALTMPGTGIIDDFGQRPLDMPMHLDRWTAAAGRRDIPVNYVSVGVSTISRASSRWLFGRSLARAAYCSFRDQVSATNAAKLGLRGQESVFPDLAFGLPDHVLQANPQASRDRPVVGLGVMGYFGWNRSAEQGARIYSAYLGKTLALVSTLVADGCDVRFLIGDLRADRRTVDELMQACLAAGIPAARLAAPQIDNYEDVVRELAQVDLVIAARFHNVLLALALQAPVISIGYSDKNDAVMAQFGLQSYCHDIERFDVGSVLQQARSLLERPGDVVGHLPQALADSRRRLELQFDDLCERWSAA
jgi:polysaccharide pyruvyl transferase WcaK-like protein